jgi:hypothetical protein
MGNLSAELNEAIRHLYTDESVDGVPAAARAELAFASDPRRIDEAKEVEPVADAFARAELHPPAGSKGLGVLGPNMVKAIGVQLGRKAPAPETRESEALMNGIMLALACGYMGALALEADNPQTYRPGTPLDRVWQVTVANFRGDGIRVLGFPSPVIANLEKLGHDAIADALHSTGILRWSTRKATLVGKYYAHAGAFMRVCQTDLRLPDRVDALAREGAPRWPFSEYVTDGALKSVGLQE